MAAAVTCLQAVAANGQWHIHKAVIPESSIAACMFVEGAGHRQEVGGTRVVMGEGSDGSSSSDLYLILSLEHSMDLVGVMPAK